MELHAKSQIPPLDADQLYAQYPRKKELFRDRMLDAQPFQQATLELIRELTLPMAVVSSSGRSEVEPPIVQAGILHYFQAMVCGLEAGKLKPEPDPYLKAASMLGARNPLVIEDSDAGAAAGHAAKFEVLRITHPSELPARLRAKLA